MIADLALNWLRLAPIYDHSRAQSAITAPGRSQQKPKGAVIRVSDTLNLSHTLGSIKRNGVWPVPEHIVLRQRMGSAELDLTEAILAAAHTVLDLDMVGGSVELRVPENMVVSAALETTLGSYQDHRKPGPDSALATASDAPAPTLTIQGRAVLGSVEVRGPKRSRRKSA